MSEQDPELEAFSKFIVAIEPWLGEVVLVGGWAHRLYRLDPRARKLDYLPLTTLDGDVAVPPKLKKEESTVRKRLLEAGFEEEFSGEDRPPTTHYHYGKGGGFYAEFLAPLEGSEYDRHGKRKATKEVGGVSSQLLRYRPLSHMWRPRQGRLRAEYKCSALKTTRGPEVIRHRSHREQMNWSWSWVLANHTSDNRHWWVAF
jgi:hypothetical protein